MIHSHRPHREVDYGPQAAKTLRQSLIRFIRQEFPRLGGPWVVELFVDELLRRIDACYPPGERLQLGQTIWQAVAVDERPGNRKPMGDTRLVPVVITLVNQEDITALRNGTPRTELLRRAIVRAANDAYAQGGVLTCADLSLLFHQSRSHIARIIDAYEHDTGQIVPRRGNVHDMGGTLTHKATICRKAYVEGKPTHVIAQETFHSPAAVDRYVLDLARVHFATVQRGMSAEQTAFAIQRPLSLVREYIRLIAAFALDSSKVYDRAGVEVPSLGSGQSESADGVGKNTERREQAPIAG
jgi:hypothetical protein